MLPISTSSSIKMVLSQAMGFTLEREALKPIYKSLILKREVLGLIGEAFTLKREPKNLVNEAFTFIQEA